MRVALCLLLASGCVVIRERAEDDVPDAPLLQCFKDGICATVVSLGRDANCPVFAIALDDQTCVVRGGPVERKNSAPIDDDSASFRVVACGVEAPVCESRLRCDCTTVHLREPCREGFARERTWTLRNRNGDSCQATLRSPVAGACRLDVSARIGKQRTEGTAAIHLFEPADVCGQTVRCGCDAFAPTSGTAETCLVTAHSETEKEGCTVESLDCVGPDCRPSRVEIEGPGKSKVVCGTKYTCPPPVVEF